jgi:hypothetical protein
MIFIEPQSDMQANIAVGAHFWQCIIPAAGTYYTEPDYDDTSNKIHRCLVITYTEKKTWKTISIVPVKVI